MGAGGRGGEGAGRQQGLRPALALAAPCPAHSAPLRDGPTPQGQTPSPGAQVSALALVQPSFPPRVHSPLAQAILGQRCLRLPLVSALIVTRPLCCHRRQSTSQPGPRPASPGLASPLLSAPFASLLPFLFPFFFPSCLFSSSFLPPLLSPVPVHLPFPSLFFSIVPHSCLFCSLSLSSAVETLH